MEVVSLAARNGLSAIALTDHDTIAGVAEAASAAGQANIDFIPGIEISAEFPSPGTLHILGYGISPDSPVLHEMTQKLIEGRDNRNPRIVARLNELGVAVTMAEWEAESKGDVLGRPQLAAVLLRKGYVSSIKDAFNKYLAQGGPAYFDKERLPPHNAFEMIRNSGGLPVLAHASQLRTENEAQLDRIVKDLVDLGLAGIEVFHSDHDEAWIAKTTALADRYHLLKTGGSDFHGTNKSNIELGLARGKRIPRQLFDDLQTAIAAQRRPAPASAPAMLPA
jgi:predicted metal-dependent phosphoesterase TrpH